MRDAIFKAVREQSENAQWKAFMCPLMSSEYGRIIEAKLYEKVAAAGFNAKNYHRWVVGVVNRLTLDLRDELDELNCKWLETELDMSQDDAVRAINEHYDDIDDDGSDFDTLPLWFYANFTTMNEYTNPVTDVNLDHYAEICQEKRPELIQFWEDNLTFDFEQELPCPK